MTTNPILDELHAARAKLLADAGGDLQTLVAAVRERQAKSGRRVVAGPVDSDCHTEECDGKIAENTDCDAEPVICTPEEMSGDDDHETQ